MDSTLLYRVSGLTSTLLYCISQAIHTEERDAMDELHCNGLCCTLL